eukprot:TRINITY_DN10134_c0_g1_i1.p1 TRINITY_DN10134_c0_g1~~TRINITY_DN10134_c0_g1_i1.p1  ORF type:complete len:893 (+),score=168.81 TRINITY_DN10134_c0_g1_i1:80-2758(+)
MITLQNFEIPNHNTCGLETKDGEPPYTIDKERRLKELVESGEMTFPEVYSRNSTKEEICLEFIDNFKNQYTQLYPSRNALLLSPRNECASRKFICTFIRPTELPYEELYDWESPTNLGKGCAAYVANYIRYEELARPTELPQVVVSPATTLKWQIGDCFDLSILLASLLLGTGYDAYVVVGYATREVCENNESRKTWTNNMVPIAADVEDSNKNSEKNKTRKYYSKLRQRPNLESVFDKQQAEKSNAAERNTPDDKKDDDKEVEDDELHGKRIHAWVMLMGSPSKRKDASIEEGDVFFVEPSTGKRAEIKDTNYLGIESVFNDTNYWVSMMENKTDKEHHEKEFFNFDLKRWEPVFVIDDEDEEEDPNDATVTERTRPTDEDQYLVPPSWVQRLTLSRRQYENRYPGHQKTIEYKNARIDLYADYSEEDLKVKVVTLKDEFGAEEEIHTFFKFRKDKLYRRARYPPKDHANTLSALGNGAVKRIQHEWFEEGRRSEQALPGGSQEALAQHIYEENKKRTMIFYSKARLDGLVKRIEVFFHPRADAAYKDDAQSLVKKIMEHYSDRDDRLVYRSATFPEPTLSNHHESRARGAHAYSGVSGAGFTESKQQPRKMAEKFDRNPEIPADQSCAKRTFYMALNEIKAEYHYGPGRITKHSRHYSKDMKIPVTIPVLQPHQKHPKQSVLAEELRTLIGKEKKCLDDIKLKQSFSEEILKNRQEEEGLTGKKCQAEITVYDTLRNETKETKIDEEQRKADERRRAEQRKDYLAPYLSQYSKGGCTKDIKLSAKDAIDVKNQVLKDLKDRLIQRAHIMQNRLDREKEELARHQTNFHKSQEQMTESKEHEHYIQIVENGMWRIGILEKRLERHQDQALQKYANLDMKLRNDGRLKEAFN